MEPDLFDVELEEKSELDTELGIDYHLTEIGDDELGFTLGGTLGVSAKGSIGDKGAEFAIKPTVTTTPKPKPTSKPSTIQPTVTRQSFSQLSGQVTSPVLEQRRELLLAKSGKDKVIEEFERQGIARNGCPKEHVYDWAKELESIKKMLRVAKVQREATSEHKSIMSRDRFRKLVLMKLNRILKECGDVY